MARKGIRRVQGQSWYLPHWLLPLLCEANGAIFDLDPCGQPAELPRRIARRRLSAADNGLDAAWKGAIFLTPQNGSGEPGPWVDKALRAVHWDKTAKVVVAVLPLQPEAAWWTSFVRGWATVFVIRSRVRIGRDWPPFGSALTIWGDAAPFRAVLERQPKAEVDGVWLPAYRADANTAPFLRRLTTRAKMAKLYGNYETFRDNLAAWTARIPPEYSDAAALFTPPPQERAGDVPLSG